MISCCRPTGGFCGPPVECVEELKLEESELKVSRLKDAEGQAELLIQVPALELTLEPTLEPILALLQQQA